MSDILGLTSFSQVRAVLSVSGADLPDARLAAYALDDDLGVELDSWVEDWQALLAAGERPAQLLKLYAKYQCAAWVAVAAQNFTLQQLTDGANAATRSTNVDFDHLREHLAGRAAYYRELLQDLLETQEGEGGTGLTVLSRVTPSRDPVTEGRG